MANDRRNGHAPGSKGRTLAPIRIADEKEAVSQEDYDLLVSLYNDRGQAALASLQGLDPDMILQMVTDFCSMRFPGGVRPEQQEGLTRLRNIATALRLLRVKYNLDDADMIQPDLSIVRVGDHMEAPAE